MVRVCICMVLEWARNVLVRLSTVWWRIDTLTWQRECWCVLGHLPLGIPVFSNNFKLLGKAIAVCLGILWQRIHGSSESTVLN